MGIDSSNQDHPAKSAAEIVVVVEPPLEPAVCSTQLISVSENEAPAKTEQTKRERINHVISTDPTDFVRELLDLERLRFSRRDGDYAGDTSPGSLLTSWAAIHIQRRRDRQSGQVQDLDIPRLAEMALKEDWCFDAKTEGDRFSILRGYLKYTFYRLMWEDKIAFTTNHAAFNTGLVDPMYRPIFAFFARNTRRGSRPYRLIDFCVVGEGDTGKSFMRAFPPPIRPKAARYISKFDDIVINPDVQIALQDSHVIDDGILEGRFPPEFLFDNMPPAMQKHGTPAKPSKDWLRKYVHAINETRRYRKKINDRIEDAKEMAMQRVRWNYKTAIPNYHPSRNAMSILLPLALLDDIKPDIALVVSPVNEHEWYGVTVYNLDMAYNSARLVCKPLSDWLTVETIAPSISEDSALTEEDSADE